MERITKTLTLDGRIAEAVQALADREKRSFTRQAEVLLEAALGQNPSEPAAQGFSKIAQKWEEVRGERGFETAY
jgi:hypothetical protein